MLKKVPYWRRINALLTSCRVKLAPEAMQAKSGIDKAHLLYLFSLQEVTRLTQVGFEGLRLQAGCDGGAMLGVHLLLCGDLEAENSVSKSEQRLNARACITFLLIIVV